jgi:hypothetical protein
MHRTASPASPGIGRLGRSALVLATFVAWTTVAAIHFYAISVWWTNSIFGPVVRVEAWIVAIGLTIWTAWVLVRRAQRALAGVTTALAVAVAATIALTDWNGTYAIVWFHTHKAQFAQAAELAESGARYRIDSTRYPWLDLPPELRALGRKLSYQDQWGRPDVAMVTVHFRYPTDTVSEYVAGFAYLADGPGRWPEHSWDGQVTPRIELGDRWWWVD